MCLRNRSKFRSTLVNYRESIKVWVFVKSGIEFNSLIGDWKFVSVWKKDNDDEDPIFSSLLRMFSAKIKFKKNISTKNLPKLAVIAIQRMDIQMKNYQL